MNYFTFESSHLLHFRNVMLPDIYEQLLEIPSFEEAGILCIGAEENGRAAGAAVVGFQEEQIASVLSLYVRPELRNHGIGTELISLVTAHAAEIFSAERGAIRFGIEIEYTVRLAAEENFIRFLQKNHFALHKEQGKTYVIPAAICRKKLHFDSSGVSCLAKCSGGTPEEIGSVLLQNGFEADPEYCFFTGNPKAPELLMIAEYGAEQDFYISSVALPDNKADKWELLSLLTSLVNEIKKEYPDFVLIADEGRNICPEIFKKLAGAGGEIYAHGTDGMVVSI